jgi:UDP-N-acetylmuramoyl-tripeptide--D-alanyl-D-alanine ligase
MNNHLTTAIVAAEMRARGYEVREGPETTIEGGAADSRAVQPGQLFTGFHGEHVDGNDFVEDALGNGATAIICERMPDGDWPGRTIVVAPDARKAVGELAHAWRMTCAPTVVGITGTVGKTTCKDITAAVLGARFNTHKSEGNLNSREGLPLALLSLRRDHEVSVLELAMDSPGEIVELCEIARPTVGVVLNIGRTHISKMGSIEAIAREKLSLARWLPEDGTAVLNVDDERIAPVVPELRCRVWSFGNRNADARLRWSDVKSEGLRGLRFWVTPGTKQARVDSPIPGEHTVPGVVAAMCVGMALGMTMFETAKAVSKSGLTGRIRILTGLNGATIIDDRYNSSPASLRGALEMLRSGGGPHSGKHRRIALIGRMAELGEFEAEEHRAAGKVAASCCDILVAVGAECVPLADAAKEAGHHDVRWFETKEEGAAEVARELRQDTVVLVKASRASAFETILPVLEGKAA